jgi:hypothetical protein
VTPGRYLRLRRQAAGLALETVPIDGVAMLAIERDVRAPTDLELWALSQAFDFDVPVLVSIARGVIPDICRGCGCSQWDPCSRMSRRAAAEAAELAVDMLLDPRAFPLEAALHQLLNAARITFELAGFEPDERERSEAYRSIVNYIDPPRRLGDASSTEDDT